MSFCLTRMTGLLLNDVEVVSGLDEYAHGEDEAPEDEESSHISKRQRVNGEGSPRASSVQEQTFPHAYQDFASRYGRVFTFLRRV